jgi:hypothetical protein
MNAATAAHYSQPLQPPTATADERVTLPLLPLTPPPPITTSSDDDDEYDEDTTTTKLQTSPTTYRSLTRDTHRGRGGWSRTGRRLHLQRNKDHGEKLGLSYHNGSKNDFMGESSKVF